MYKLLKPIFPDMTSHCFLRLSDNTYIPFDPANTDYQNFKAQINDETAQLETADGNLMSAQQAKAYVATLP